MCRPSAACWIDIGGDDVSACGCLVTVDIGSSYANIYVVFQLQTSFDVLWPLKR